MSETENTSTEAPAGKYEYDYTTVGVSSGLRDELKELRDEGDFPRYEELIRSLIQNSRSEISQE